MNPIALLALFFLAPFTTFAQSDNDLIREGNTAYNKQQYEAARDNYKKAVEKSPANQKAQYNLGNASYKSKKPEDAVEAYDAAIQNSNVPIDKSGAFYNKGVVLQNSKKLPECIEAYKNALRLNPADEDARLNLQKALQQQKQQQQQENKKDNKNQKKPKDDPKKDQQKKKQEDDKKNDQPKPQPSKMTKKEAEEKLNALLQQEKKLQDKLRKVNAASPEKPEKDW